MKWYITLILVLGILFSFLTGGLSIQAADEGSKYSSNIESCLAKRDAGTERSETEFVCPTGDFFILPDGTRYPFTNQANIAYQVVVSRAFNELDKEVKTYLEKLQKERKNNPASWTEDIRNTIENTYKDKYTTICSSIAKKEVEKWIEERNKTENKVSNTTDIATSIAALSDSYSPCMLLVKNKITAFQNISMMLAAQGITKSFTNDKSEFTEKIKTKYDGLLETWRNYVAALTKATDKWNAYIKNPSIAP